MARVVSCPSRPFCFSRRITGTSDAMLPGVAVSKQSLALRFRSQPVVCALLFLVQAEVLADATIERASHPGRRQVWPLSARELSQLPEKMRNNARAVGQLFVFRDGRPSHCGTAMLAHVDKKLGYVWTNAHVVTEATDRTVAGVDFHPLGSDSKIDRAFVRSVVAHVYDRNMGWDWTLAEVDLRQSLMPLLVTTPRIDLRQVDPRPREVYAAGFSDPTDLVGRGLLSDVDLRPLAPMLKEVSAGASPLLCARGKTATKDSHTEDILRIPLAKGGSGTPVFDQRTHTLLGIAQARDRKDPSRVYMTNIFWVLNDLFLNHAEKPVVQAILKRAHFPGAENLRETD